MSIRKMQTIKSTQGFTLVELIVVITILAVLAAIAFISIGNVTGDARNSKRQNDLSSISTAVRNIVEIKGMPIINAVSDTGSGRVMLTSVHIAGRDISDAKLEYKAGDVYYDQIQIKNTEFQDPNGIPYIIGATKLAGQVFEVAASLELPGNKKAAYLIGTFVPRKTAEKNSFSGIVDADHFKITLQRDQDVGKFKIGDIITSTIGTQNAEIINLSSDGRTLTYDPVAASGSTEWTSSGATEFLFTGSTSSADIKSFYLGSGNAGTGSIEPDGLIKGQGTCSSASTGYPAVTSDSQTCIPY